MHIVICKILNVIWKYKKKKIFETCFCPENMNASAASTSNSTLRTSAVQFCNRYEATIGLRTIPYGGSDALTTIGHVVDATEHKSHSVTATNKLEFLKTALFSCVLTSKFCQSTLLLRFSLILLKPLMPLLPVLIIFLISFNKHHIEYVHGLNFVSCLRLQVLI